MLKEIITNIWKSAWYIIYFYIFFISKYQKCVDVFKSKISIRVFIHIDNVNNIRIHLKFKLTNIVHIPM